MSNSNIEIEAKYILHNPQECANKLEVIAKALLKDQLQCDHYFIPQHRNFLLASPISEWLRIRETKSGSTLNYKNWHNKKGLTLSCDEYEIAIEKPNIMKIILTELDFKEIVTVEKYRSSWLYRGVEISIDKVTNLGSYVEFEIKESSNEETSKHNKLIQSIISDFNFDLGEQNYEGYPILILNNKKDGQ